MNGPEIENMLQQMQQTHDDQGQPINDAPMASAQS